MIHEYSDNIEGKSSSQGRAADSARQPPSFLVHAAIAINPFIERVSEMGTPARLQQLYLDR
jgi:hypothetical protein